MDDKQNQQELLFKFSMFEQQIQQLQQQIEAVEKGIVELNSLSFGLDELVDGKDKEIFAPIGRGIFVKTRLVSEELSVDVGGGNLIKKNIPETKKLIGEQIKKLEQVRKELESNLEEVGKELQKIMNQAQSSHTHSKSCNCKEEKDVNIDKRLNL